MFPRRYVGFWYRLSAALIDSLLFMLLMGLIMWAWYVQESVVSWDYVYREPAGGGVVDAVVSWLLPAVVTMLFWDYKMATPGKMVISAKIVDADSGARPSPKQWIFRYLGYFASALPMGLGFLWIAFDARKQGWHDKMANTVVIFSRGERNANQGHASAPAGELGPGSVVHVE